MAFLPFSFDANAVAPAVEPSAVPAGEYLVAITDSAMEATKLGDGKYLKLVFTILDGPYKGWKIFDRLNLVNKNQPAVEIGQRALSAICHAVKVLELTDSCQLHDKPLRVKVSYERAQNGYSEQNRVKAYKAASASAGGINGKAVSPGNLGHGAASPTSPPIPLAGQAAPWKKKAQPVAAPSPQPEVELAEDDTPF